MNSYGVEMRKISWRKLCANHIAFIVGATYDAHMIGDCWLMLVDNFMYFCDKSMRLASTHKKTPALLLLYHVAQVLWLGSHVAVFATVTAHIVL